LIFIESFLTLDCNFVVLGVHRLDLYNPNTGLHFTVIGWGFSDVS